MPIYFNPVDNMNYYLCDEEYCDNCKKFVHDIIFINVQHYGLHNRSLHKYCPACGINKMNYNQGVIAEWLRCIVIHSLPRNSAFKPRLFMFPGTQPVKNLDCFSAATTNIDCEKVVNKTKYSFNKIAYSEQKELICDNTSVFKQLGLKAPNENIDGLSDMQIKCLVTDK